MTNPASRWTRPLLIGGLVLLTLAGFGIRAQRLRGVDGMLGEDQARLALAATRILETGLPAMPSGRVYLRGLPSSYLTAGSLAIFGRNDFAARLPNAVVGALLIPVMFLFGRALAGTVAGLCLAVFATVQRELVYWSTDAWTTLPFVAAFLTAAYLLYLGYERDRPGMQVAGAAATVLAVLVHELGVLLVAAVAAALAVRAIRRDTRWWHGSRSVLALCLLALGVLLFVGFGLALRAGTLAGATAEFAMYLGPSLSFERFLADLERWRFGYLLLLLSAAAGLPFLWRGSAPGALLPYLAAAVVAVTVWFILSKTSERYGLVLLPLVALLAAWALGRIAGWIGSAGHSGLRLRGYHGALLIGSVFAISVAGDLRALTSRRAPPARSWLTELRELGWNPDDIMVSDNPPIQAFYLGRVDYWVRPEGHERYSFVSGQHLRDVYSGAIRLGSEEEFREMLRANLGRTLWYVGEARKIDARLGPTVREWLLGSAQAVRYSEDGAILVRTRIDAASAP